MREGAGSYNLKPSPIQLESVTEHHFKSLTNIQAAYMLSETQNDAQSQTPIEWDLASGCKNLRPLAHPVSRIYKDKGDENFDEVEVSIYKKIKRSLLPQKTQS